MTISILLFAIYCSSIIQWSKMLFLQCRLHARKNYKRFLMCYMYNVLIVPMMTYNLYKAASTAFKLYFFLSQWCWLGYQNIPSHSQKKYLHIAMISVREHAIARQTQLRAIWGKCKSLHTLAYTPVKANKPPPCTFGVGCAWPSSLFDNNLPGQTRSSVLPSYTHFGEVKIRKIGLWQLAFDKEVKNLVTYTHVTSQHYQ